MRMTNEVRNVGKQVTNFMNGISYVANPIDTLKMVTASSIFGEPQYYQEGAFVKKDSTYTVNINVIHDLMILKDQGNLKTSQIMENVIDKALDFDFQATILWALELRYEFYMRLNPQVIMVRAALHKSREAYNKKYPGKFRHINNQIMKRADEPASQLTYYLYLNKSKRKIPSLLKRCWKQKLESVSKNEINKYKNNHIGMINTIRICHANNKNIDELMRTKKVVNVKKTWNQQRSKKKKWIDILQTTKLPHMALLKNLRGIFSEVHSDDICERLMNDLVSGVKDGMQFPYRYYMAREAIIKEDLFHKTTILNSLEKCIDCSLDNLPRLKGKTVCLSDNSGSAWGAFTSEFGKATVGHINNLSSVLTAMNSEEGEVIKFGDTIKKFFVSNRNGALYQANHVSENQSSDVGASTENGIWMFLDDCIKKKRFYDNIFIYSDQQAGHGGLYGINSLDYKDFCIRDIKGSRYIDVNKMIKVYRQSVNPNVNVFSVQTAGYDNILIPEYLYRSCILTGWTGKEIIFAEKMIKIWDGLNSNSTNLS